MSKEYFDIFAATAVYHDLFGIPSRGDSSDPIRIICIIYIYNSRGYCGMHGILSDLITIMQYASSNGSCGSPVKDHPSCKTPLTSSRGGSNPPRATVAGSQ